MHFLLRLVAVPFQASDRIDAVALLDQALKNVPADRPGDLQDVARRLTGTMSGTVDPGKLDSRPLTPQNIGTRP